MTSYLVTRPILIGDTIHQKGDEVECRGRPAAGLIPASDDAVEPARRARLRRRLERWLKLGAALIERL